MTGFRQPPRRHWRSYGNDPLPVPAEAMSEPFSAFPSWFLRVECDRCGKPTMINEAHCTQRQRQRALPLRDFLARMRHDGCGGGQGRRSCSPASTGANSRPVRKIVLRAE